MLASSRPAGQSVRGCLLCRREQPTQCLWRMGARALPVAHPVAALRASRPSNCAPANGASWAPAMRPLATLTHPSPRCCVKIRTDKREESESKTAHATTVASSQDALAAGTVRMPDLAWHLQQLLWQAPAHARMPVQCARVLRANTNRGPVHSIAWHATAALPSARNANHGEELASSCAGTAAC